MDRLKTFAIYIIIGVLFWILSDILIEVGIDSTYKNMSQKGTIPDGIEVIQMQSTAVNGRIHLKINNTGYSGKFLKIDLYKFEKKEKFFFENLYLALGLVVTFIISIAIVWSIQTLKNLFIDAIRYVKNNLKKVEE